MKTSHNHKFVLYKWYNRCRENGENHVQIYRLEHYYDPADYNKVIYRQRKEYYNQRLKTILLDADCLLQKCNGGYDEISEYQLLVLAFSEQVIKENNTLRLKNKEDGEMNSSMLQNPSDLEVTYREKAGSFCNYLFEIFIAFSIFPSSFQ